MAAIALFHSVLGMRPGMQDAADRLRSQGHEVLPVDQYDGTVFEDYSEAAAFVEQSNSFPKLMTDALSAVKGLPDGFLCVGFSNGGGIAEYIATQRQVSGVVLCSGAVPLHVLGGDVWPAGVPVQIHYTIDDPFRQEGWAESVVDSVMRADGDAELFNYAGTGHLFTDSSLPNGCVTLIWPHCDGLIWPHLRHAGALL